MKGEDLMSAQRKIKSFEELRFSDDFMFGKVMEDNELCRQVLERLLQRPVGKLTEVQTQKEFKHTSEGKPIRLDVYNEDSEGKIYDAEMQNLNRKTVESHQLPKRSRYYQGSIDVDFLEKGNSYKKLPECSIMFICTFDPFEKGLCKYTFHERCDEKPEICLDDGTVKIFYNCSYKGEDIPDELKLFYDYVENGHPNDELSRKIEEAVDKGRCNETWRSQYMKERIYLQDARDEAYEEGREEGRVQGIEYGKKEGAEAERKKSIEDMLRRGKTVEEIADFCGYSKDYIKQVEESMLTKV